MLKNDFALGLLNETKDSIAQQIAMWENLSLWKVIWQKLKGKIKRYDAIKDRMDACTSQLKRFQIDGLRLKKLCLLAKHLEVQLPEHASLRDIDDISKEIEEKSILLLRETDKNFRGRNTRDMASYVLKKMFDDFSEHFDGQDQETQGKVLKKIMESLESMSEEQLERLKRELKVEELTDTAIRKAIITGSLGAAFAVVVEVAGFSAYIFAVQALAGVAGLVGITLPFALYTTLTSAIAVLASVEFLGPVALVVGWWLTRRTNRKIRNGLVPALVIQAVVSSALGSPSDTTIQSFLKRYEKDIVNNM